VPGDLVVAPLVAATAAEYAPEARTERAEPAAPLVEVLLTQGRDRRLEDALAGLAGVHASAPFDSEAQPTERHRLTTDAVRRFEPAAAVVIGGSRAMVEDLSAVREAGVRAFPIVPTLTGPVRERRELWEGPDLVERALADLGSQDDEEARAIPYPYVMQRLVELLGEFIEG